MQEFWANTVKKQERWEGEKVFATEQRKMGLSRFPDAFEGGVIPLLIIRTALSIAMVRDVVISFLQKMGLKVITEQPELAQSSRSFAYAEEEAAELGSGFAELAMTIEDIGDKLPVSLFQVSSSSSSCSCSCACSCSGSDGDGVTECVVCLRKFLGGEEVRSLPCRHVFHKICVDKWILDYQNMTCPLCRVCLVFSVEDELRR